MEKTGKELFEEVINGWVSYKPYKIITFFEIHFIARLMRELNIPYSENVVKKCITMAKAVSDQFEIFNKKEITKEELIDFIDNSIDVLLKDCY